MNYVLRLLSRYPVLCLRFRREERGATATEYSILAGFIAFVIVAGVSLFGVALNSFYGFLTTGIRAALGLP